MLEIDLKIYTPQAQINQNQSNKNQDQKLSESKDLNATSSSATDSAKTSGSYNPFTYSLTGFNQSASSNQPGVQKTSNQSASSQDQQITSLKPGELQSTLEKRAKDSGTALSYGGYSKHSGFSVGKDIVLNTKDGYYKEKSDKTWAALDATKDADLIKKLDAAKAQDVTKNQDPANATKDAEQSNKALEQAKEGNLTQPSPFSALVNDPTFNALKSTLSSLEGLTGLPPMLGPTLSNIFPAKDLGSKSFENTIADKISSKVGEKYYEKKIIETYMKDITKGVEYERNLAARLEDRAGPNPTKKDLETIAYLKEDAAAWEKEAKTPLSDDSVVTTSTGTYPKLAMGFRDHFTKDRLPMFEEATKTGLLNGKAIDISEAKELHRQAEIYLNIVNGKYNLTPDGRPSQSAHMMAMFLSDPDDIRDQLKNFGLKEDSSWRTKS